MGTKFFNGIWIAAICVFATARSGRAQSPSAQDANGMVQLMTSQAPVDISSPPVATASFDPPVVRAGELAIYRVTVNAIESAIRVPAKVPAAKELTVQATSQGQVLPMAAGMIRPTTTFNYAVRASKSGLFNVPAHYIEVSGKPVVVPEAWLEALEELPENHEPARRLNLEAAVTNVFVGQNFPVRILLSSSRSNSLEGLSQLQINGDGFVPDKNFHATIESPQRQGRLVPTLIYQTTVRAVAAGQLSLSAQGFTAGNDFGGRIVIFGQVTLAGGPARNILLDSDPVTINARPLPPGALAGFTGAIGPFTRDPPRLETNSVRAGDPAQLTVIVRGEAGLAQLVPPPPPRSTQWQIFPATEGGFVPATEGTYPGAIFHYTLIPLTTDVRATPAIPFSCFDPVAEKFLDLTVPPVPITVTGENLPADWAGISPANSREPATETKLSLSGLASARGVTAATLTPVQLRGWFPFAQLSPLLVFAALWSVERRRRFLEANPEFVRRRRARRELRRHRRLLQRAVAAQDGDEFVRRAIASLQIACAPHYPAEPRALVCGEVQALLTDRNGDARVVQRFFDAANASRFGTSTRMAGDLIAHQPELNAVLDKLEERLCD